MHQGYENHMLDLIGEFHSFQAQTGESISSYMTRFLVLFDKLKVFMIIGSSLIKLLNELPLKSTSLIVVQVITDGVDDHTHRWEPQEEGMMQSSGNFPRLRNQGYQSNRILKS